MNFFNKSDPAEAGSYQFFRSLLLLIANCSLLIIISCAQFTYKTYDEKLEQISDDPEPDYSITLNNDFQNYTNFLFIGNRVENFGTYFNTYFNAKEDFADAYEDYSSRILANYSERLDSVYINPQLSQESIDKFNKCIQKASRVIQYHKSSAYMDQAVILIGRAYFCLGDYLKAERKFSEFISKLSKSEHLDEAVLYLSRAQLRLNNEAALDRLRDLIGRTPDNSIKALAYQTLAEHYIHKKDYESAIANYKKSIEFSSDDVFRAQMQYLIASVISRKDPLLAANEYKKVLEFGTTFDLEYYSWLNYTRNLILSGNFSESAPLLEQMKVKYKDIEQFQSEIDLLHARYYEQKKEYRKAVDKFKSVIKTYPKSAAASDAAWFIADYYENNLGNFLDAYRFYKLSNEQNSAGHYSAKTNAKISTFKRYFELRSVITGHEIKTDYGDEINKLFKENINNTEGNTEGNQKGEIKEEKGKHKGQGQGESNSPLKSMSLQDFSGEGDRGGCSPFRHFTGSPFHHFTDSLDKTNQVDSFAVREEKIAAAEFELAELFIYDLSKNDSAESYLLQSFDRSSDYDFKSKVLFALANLYINQNRTEKGDETLHRIVQDFPRSKVSNSARRLLNIDVIEETTSDIADSIYSEAETGFSSRDYNLALNNFILIVNNYPSSRHFSRSVYASGWIYENILAKPDSAYVYYEKLLTLDPKSEFALFVAGKVGEYKTNMNGLQDSSVKSDTTHLKNENLNNGENMNKDLNDPKDKGLPDEMKKDELKKEDYKKEDESLEPPKQKNF